MGKTKEGDTNTVSPSTHEMGLVAAATTTTAVVTIIVVNQQENDDDEQNPGAVVAAEKITQTHVIPPPYIFILCYCIKDGA